MQELALAIPKSMILGTGTPSCSATRTLDGLTSRWMIPFWCRQEDLFALHVATVPDTFLPAGLLHQNPPHRLRRRREEVPPAIPVLGFLHVHEPDVRLMHQRRGFQIRASAHDYATQPGNPP